tara:strand:- start:177 stop:401 length:225 start_codon:yes stop_codon:yes gene_type:complete
MAESDIFPVDEKPWTIAYDQAAAHYRSAAYHCHQAANHCDLQLLEEAARHSVAANNHSELARILTSTTGVQSTE